MFFQNHCRSLRRRRSWEQTWGRKKKIQYPEEFGKNWKQGGNPTRVISSGPPGLGAKLHCYTPRKKILHQENYLRLTEEKLGPVVTL